MPPCRLLNLRQQSKWLLQGPAGFFLGSSCSFQIARSPGPQARRRHRHCICSHLQTSLCATAYGVPLLAFRRAYLGINRSEVRQRGSSGCRASDIGPSTTGHHIQFFLVLFLGCGSSGRDFVDKARHHGYQAARSSDHHKDDERGGVLQSPRVQAPNCLCPNGVATDLTSWPPEPMSNFLSLPVGDPANELVCQLPESVTHCDSLPRLV